ncbi:MAG: RNA polymerase sigma factor [Actinomycetota bacterium]|jgi:RNA polymerase sigma factor (sigma-70 family)|nr:RNA polymerase sigma factor [Actinomycetota bacterium]
MTTSQQDRSDQIAALYTTFAARLVALVATHIRAPRDTIEDACAFAWETLLTRTHVRLERDGVRTWLVRVATHEALRLLRDAQRQRPSGTLDADYDSEPEPGTLHAVADLNADTADLATERLANDHRRAALADLKPREQRDLVLQAAGYTYDEIADLTDSTRTAVNRRITEGRAALRTAAADHTPSTPRSRAPARHEIDLRLAQAGYTADQIAEVTNTTPAAVNRRLRAARAALRNTDA